jgi:hypothetical protein
VTADKLLHYHPGAQFNWTSEGDWSALEWQGPGEKPDEAEFAALPWPISPVPAFITPRQAKLALLGLGKLDEIDAAVAASDRATQISWEYAIEFRREDPLLNSLAASLGWTAEGLDDFFRDAAAIA